MDQKLPSTHNTLDVITWLFENLRLKRVSNSKSKYPLEILKQISFFITVNQDDFGPIFTSYTLLIQCDFDNLWQNTRIKG